MSQKKRKRAYIQPEHEIVNKRQRSPRARQAPRARRDSGAAGGGIRRRDGKEFVMPVPTFKRTLRRVPIYLIMIFALYYFTLPKTGGSDTQRMLAAASTALVVTVAFTPMMFMMERWQYARYLRKGGRVVADSKQADDAG